MKRQVRAGVFETNSSSTHTLTICSKRDFERWKQGELLLDEWNNKFIAVKNIADKDIESYYDKIKKQYYKDYKDLNEKEKEDVKNSYMSFEFSGKTYADWGEDDCLESYMKEYTTESGDEIVVFGEYGYN